MVNSRYSAVCGGTRSSVQLHGPCYLPNSMGPISFKRALASHPALIWFALNQTFRESRRHHKKPTITPTNTPLKFIPSPRLFQRHRPKHSQYSTLLPVPPRMPSHLLYGNGPLLVRQLHLRRTLGIVTTATAAPLRSKAEVRQGEVQFPLGYGNIQVSGANHVDAESQCGRRRQRRSSGRLDAIPPIDNFHLVESSTQSGKGS
mmetsp:Transcript_14084/g.25104  ORF Transcript_14084/g.25104 Transcript_14084/m.25104 type:complete len:203 (+) Transcript_14084:86-694(+)